MDDASESELQEVIGSYQQLIDRIPCENGCWKQKQLRSGTTGVVDFV